MYKSVLTYLTRLAGAAIVLCLAWLIAVPAAAQDKAAATPTSQQQQLELPVRNRHHKPDTTQVTQVETAADTTLAVDIDRNARSAVVDAHGDTVRFTAADSLRYAQLADSTYDPDLGRIKIFNPDPMRAMWLSALCPGLGQIYNHRYWKLPIVVGAFVGLTYATSWNNRMLNDYTKGYRDLMDNDPNTRSYMDFFPSTVKESSLDRSWLERTLKSRKNYYRRYKEICIISIVAVYLINIVDAYVDASLAHFDISDDLSMNVGPAAIAAPQVSRWPSMGMHLGFNF